MPCPLIVGQPEARDVRDRYLALENAVSDLTVPSRNERDEASLVVLLGVKASEDPSRRLGRAPGGGVVGNVPSITLQPR